MANLLPSGALVNVIGIKSVLIIGTMGYAREFQPFPSSSPRPQS